MRAARRLWRPIVARKALENNLMLARARDRLPHSRLRSARAAEQCGEIPSAYDAYFAALELMAAPNVGGGVTLQNFRAVREERLKLVAELEKDTSASAMKAYFFIAPVLQLRDFRELKPTVDAVLAVHPDDLSLKYRMLAFQPTYPEMRRAISSARRPASESTSVDGGSAFPDRRSLRCLSRADARERACPTASR